VTGDISMTKGLPATLEAAVETAAVAHARRHVRRLKSGEISAQPLELLDSESVAPWSWFGRENSRAWVKARLKARLRASAANPQLASFVCGLARDGVSLADEALREIIIEHKERDEKLLVSLRAYDIEITKAGRRRRGGWDTTEVILRNLAIASVVADVCRAFGLPPTRSRASRRHGLSGCYIASRALEEEREAISEASVARTWTRYGFLLGPDA
jgi:hypothetical protein